MKISPVVSIPLVTLLVACSGGGASTPVFGDPTPTQSPAPTAPPETTSPTPTGDDSTPPPTPTHGTQAHDDPTPAPGTTPAASLNLVACTVQPEDLPAAPQASITDDGTYRYITGNGIPDHPVGSFPNGANPNTIDTVDVSYRVRLSPTGSGSAAALGPTGVAVNAIKFDAGAAEFWMNDRNSGWQYEALGGGINLGVDCNYAHVQPDGSYHYHGMPEGLLNALGGGVQMHHVGYAADGYPIYARYGYSDPNDAQSRLRAIISSYRLKQGTRPDGPGGTYDGTFLEDYEYVPGLGDLDDCNGRMGLTPDFGETYHYFLTNNFPFIPRCTVATPDASFQQQGGPPGGGPPRAAHPPTAAARITQP